MKHRTDMKNQAKNIKSNNNTKSNREKSNIVIANEELIALKLFDTNIVFANYKV